jgi:ankyrin repeat protein
MYAAAKGSLECAKLLLQHGADADAVATRRDGASFGDALGAAAQNGHVEIVRLLLRAGAKVGSKGDQRADPVMLASARGSHQVLKELIAHGADIQKERTWPGYGKLTPLMAAAIKGDLDSVRVILEAGADVNTRSEGHGRGRTALHYALSENRRLEVIQMLLAYGADVSLRDEEGASPLNLALRAVGNPDQKKILSLLQAGQTAKRRSQPDQPLERAP